MSYHLDMKMFVGMIIDQHSNVVVDRQDGDGGEDWIRMELSEDISISGPASQVQRWADDLQMKVRTV